MVISTHTPLARRDFQEHLAKLWHEQFLLTCPLRGTTQHVGTWEFTAAISTHAPLTWRDPIYKCALRHPAISTHTPHAGRDTHTNPDLMSLYLFLLTRPMRGATRASSLQTNPATNFYSHAPCGARRHLDRLQTGRGYFYSHAPCGARQGSKGGQGHAEHFYSHASYEARLFQGGSQRGAIHISTHTPLTRRDD